MICPQCQTRVSDDAVICDSCNAILDTSFLGDDITNEERARAAPPAEATRIKAVDAGATRIKAVEPAPAKPKADPNATRVKAAPPEPPPARRKAIIEGSIAEDSDAEIAGNQARKKLSALVDAAAPPAETAQAFDELVGQFKALPFSERLTVGSALGVMLTLALPWKWTEDEGDIIGLMAGAWPVGLMTVLVAAGLFLRRHPLARPHKDKIFALVAGLAGFSLLVAFDCFRTLPITKTLHAGGRLVPHIVQDRSFGMYLGLVACAVMLAGAVKTYLGREKLD